MTDETTKVYYPVRSWAEYRQKYPKATVILELKENPRASKWGRAQLVAFRVIQRKAAGSILPVLKDFAPTPKDLEHHLNSAKIIPLIAGIPRDDLLFKSPLELKTENGRLGHLWFELWQCVQPPSEQEDSQDQSMPERESQEFFKPGSIHGSKIDKDKHDNRTKSNALIVNLARDFIDYVLIFCAEQDSEKQMVLEFLGNQHRVCYYLPELKLDATDDGGIWPMATERLGKSPWKCMRRLVPLDAKKAFQHIDIDGQPVVSDASWSQYICEALTALLENPGQADVFVVAMTQKFMRFLHFHCTEAYMQYLLCRDVDKQKSSDAWLDVTESEFFALDSEDGRRNALCNLLGLVKFWEQQLMIAKEESENQSEDESKNQLEDESEN